jgi:hypothetical protein
MGQNMKTDQAAVAETPEEIEARLKQEAIDSGEDFAPSGDGLADSGEGSGATKPNADGAIDAEFLEALAGEEKPKMIPHARFNEVNEESKERARRIQELELALARMEGKAEASAPKPEKKDDAKADAYDFDAAEDLYSAAILDGDPSKAKAIRAEIRKHEQADFEARAEALADKRYDTRRAEDEAKRTKLEFELELSKAYQAYPFLDGSSAEPNAAAIEETMVWTQYFLNKGKTSAEALSAAVAKVGPAHAPKESVQAAKTEAPKVDVKLGMDRAGKIPAKPEGIGERASTVDVSKMSAKDIKALPSDVEARLAGDVV